MDVSVSTVIGWFLLLITMVVSSFSLSSLLKQEDLIVPCGFFVLLIELYITFKCVGL